MQEGTSFQITKQQHLLLLGWPQQEFLGYIKMKPKIQGIKNYASKILLRCVQCPQLMRFKTHINSIWSWIGNSYHSDYAGRADSPVALAKPPISPQNVLPIRSFAVAACAKIYFVRTHIASCLDGNFQNIPIKA